MSIKMECNVGTVIKFNLGEQGHINGSIIIRYVPHLESHGFLLDASRMKSLPLSPLLTEGVAMR